MADPRLELNPALRARISGDLRPVTPLARPLRRMLSLVPLALLTLVAAVVMFGVRRDAPELGVGLTWTASALQMILGLGLIAAALRESVPGTTLPRRIVGLIFGTALTAVLAVTLLTWSASPTTIAKGFAAHVWRICVAGTIVSALPALAVSGWLAARAFPLRPALAGALYGVGAGLMADAGWRLFCHFSDPVHVLGAHTLAVGAVGIVGATVATLGSGGARKR